MRIKMLKFSAAVVSVLLLSAVHHSSCERFNIVPSPDSPCPGEFTGEPCVTLEQYVANPSLSVQNITFELHPGNHRLNSQLRLSNINSLVMRATASTTVTCSQQLEESFYFDRLQQIHVSGITFAGCRMYLDYITNATFEKNSFVNATRCCLSGAALHVQYSSVIIRSCIISNNRQHNEGTIYGAQSTVLIEQITFSGNSYGGAVYTSYGSTTIRNSNFSSNSANPDFGPGGAIYNYGGVVSITGTNFNGNRAGRRSHGGAIYTLRSTKVTITDCTFNDNRAGITGGAVFCTTIGPAIMNITGSYFSDNSAGSHGGTIYFDGGNIAVTNSTFINNTASGGGGGVIYSAKRYTNITLVNNIFSQNTAAYCGVMAVVEFYHYNVNITGNMFTYNKAVQQISGNTGGGVICIRNASMFIIDNIFSQNSAVGDAGVIQVDESDIIIERSIFSNNTAGENGGVLYTRFYPTRYTITDSSFTNNQAGGDGGMMYVGRAGSHVTISQSTFGFNTATNRGGVIAIIGSTLEIDRADIFENTAELGEVISACNSDVTITNPELLANQDPIHSFCTLYNGSYTTISMTTEQATPTTVTGITTDTSTTAASSSTTTERDTLITTTLSLTNNVTSTEAVTKTIETTPQTEGVTSTTEDITNVTTKVSTSPTEVIGIATATTQPLQEITASDKAIITSTYKEVTTMEESHMIRTTTSPQSSPPESNTTPESKAAVPTITTRPVINSVIDQDQDTAGYNLDYIVPGYVSIGVSAVLFVVVAFFGVFLIIIAVKVFRVKTKSQNINLSAHDYPKINNEYSLPDVHVAHT